MDVVTVRLSEIAKWERAKAGKTYPEGCTLLQISATRGQLVYLDHTGPADSKYAVIEPVGVSGFYLFCLLESQMPEFLKTHQTGLNIRPEVLNEMTVNHYPDPAIQTEIELRMQRKDEGIRLKEKQLEKLQQIKAFLLENCFPKAGQDEPDFRF